MINYHIYNSNFNQINLEKQLLKYFKFNTGAYFLQELMFLGFDYAWKYSFSLNLESFKNYFYLNELLRKNENLRLTSLWNYSILNLISYNSTFKISKILTKFFECINEYKSLYSQDTILHLMITTGAKANFVQLLQWIGIRGFLSNNQGRLYEIPVMQNFSRGLNLYEYFISCYGARKGVIDTAIKTADSGYLTRRLIEVSRDIVIKEVNCGTNATVYNTFNWDCSGHFTDKNDIIFIKGLKLSNFQNQIKLKNLRMVKQINFRSIFTCSSGKMICNQCYNFKVSLNQTNLGESVGILAAQSIGEPATQLTLRTFHTGGVFTKLKMNLEDKQFKHFNTFKFLWLNNNFKIFRWKIFTHYKNLFLNSHLISFKDGGIIEKQVGEDLKHQVNHILSWVNECRFQYKTLYNSIQVIKLKVNCLSSTSIYKPYQIFNLNPINLIKNSFTDNMNKIQIIPDNSAIQYFTNRLIYIITKNANSEWIIKNLNKNIIYPTTLGVKLISNNFKLKNLNNFNWTKRWSITTHLSSKFLLLYWQNRFLNFKLTFFNKYFSYLNSKNVSSYRFISNKGYFNLN
uniref:DNA-directed RNA polymerase n=1 Tax=Nephromyces sp. ex Molgula occidentalis TaxID=2544991 RepID=A0A5C1H7V8_9APIC|nr:plastid-encoded DNA-directed RNA polymerase beta''A [Nephromyces sp. ex Molgula occidentalis]